MTNLPSVSICTPTYNRREFFGKLIEMVNKQDYPKKLIQWVIVDDGEDKIKDMIDDNIQIDNVEYVELDKKIPIGEKRNLMHNYCTGNIIVYMDDDDYYPSTRISHAVDTLIKTPDALCSGCSKIYVYFTESKEMLRFGPYNDNHATANTFAFWRKLLDQTQFENASCVSEEKYFLKNYTIPFVQLDVMKTILVISHKTNTFDKNKIKKYSKKSKKNFSDFIF